MHYVSETSSSINMDIVFWCVLTHTHLSLLNLQPTPPPPPLPSPPACFAFTRGGGVVRARAHWNII